MAEEDLGICLGADDRLRLDDLAVKRGISLGELAAELVRQELALRTRPKPVRGNVQPFRRRPE
jgi:hypothetical protein